MIHMEPCYVYELALKVRVSRSMFRHAACQCAQGRRDPITVHLLPFFYPCQADGSADWKGLFRAYMALGVEKEKARERRSYTS
jgi:hypothetical protein